LDSFYSYGRCQLNRGAVVDKVNSLKMYSQYLRSVLTEMLEFSEE
jgi:hypothetical protein